MLMILLLVVQVCRVLIKLSIIMVILEQHFFITFNAKKTICIKFGESIKLTEQGMMNSNVLSWHSEVRHIGNLSNSCLDSNRECSL